MTANPEDILVVCWSEERRLYPQFEGRRIVSITHPERFQGLKFRTAWVTEQAYIAVRAKGWEVLEREAWFQDAQIKHVNEYEEGA